MGGSLGTAVLGAIFSATGARQPARRARPPRTWGSGAVDPSAMQSLPAAVRDPYISAFTDSLSTVFLVATAIMVVAFLMSWFIEERPLRKTVETAPAWRGVRAAHPRRLRARALARARPARRSRACAGVHRAHRRGCRRGPLEPGRRGCSCRARRAPRCTIRRDRRRAADRGDAGAHAARGAATSDRWSATPGLPTTATPRPSA